MSCDLGIFADEAAGTVSPVLQSWLQMFDPAGLESDGDEADLHHDG